MAFKISTIPEKKLVNEDIFGNRLAALDFSNVNTQLTIHKRSSHISVIGILGQNHHAF